VKQLEGALWAILLAGGEGVRLRPLIRELCGDERPKQFATIVGSKSLLSHRLGRVALKIRPERTAIVTCRHIGKSMEQEFTATLRQRVLVQPEDRGTAADICFPAHWINSQDPEAVVAVFRSDHFILEESTFMSHVANVAAYVQRKPDRLVLFGQRRMSPIRSMAGSNPVGPVGKRGGDSLLHVSGFREKPTEGRARACLASGCLMEHVAVCRENIDAARCWRRFLPHLMVRMGRADRLLPTERLLSIEQEYGRVAKADFSRTVLEACPALLAVSTIQGVTWSDLGPLPKSYRQFRQWRQERMDAVSLG